MTEVIQYTNDDVTDAIAPCLSEAISRKFLSYAATVLFQINAEICDLPEEERARILSAVNRSLSLGSNFYFSQERLNEELTREEMSTSIKNAIKKDQIAKIKQSLEKLEDFS